MARSPLALLLAAFTACNDRTQTHSDAGRELAEHLCAVQHDCGCEDDVIISDCEVRVEQAFLESEHEALAAGLTYDDSCMEHFIEGIDALGACSPDFIDHGSQCPVYHNEGDLGDSCEVFDLIPWMQGCKVGLSCINHVCRDPDNPTILPLGAICSEYISVLPSRWMGVCDEGLFCDSLDTRTCIPSTANPAPLGGPCTFIYECLDDGICEPQDGDPEPSVERPGVCVARTPPGEPCTLAWECDRLCEAGYCQVPPPWLCETLGTWWHVREVQ